MTRLLVAAALLLLAAPAWAQSYPSPTFKKMTMEDGELTINSPARFHSIKGSFLTVNARSLFNSPASGEASNWLGNDDGVPNLYGYGKFGQGVFLSGIGDVGVVGATRTEDVTTGGRLPIGTMGWAFNFKTTAPQTAWAGYFEARRKLGAGQIHGMEINVTDLGDGSDAINPTAMASGPNAAYSAWASGLNIAAGGNVRPGGQIAWDGTQNVTQAADVGPALPIYSNGAKFAKGIIIAENALVGCTGAGGPAICTGLEMGRGTQVAWIDGTTRQASRVWSDTSSSGNAMEMVFSDFGVRFHAFGGTTFQVVGAPSDVNGVQVFAGSSAGAPARLVAAGSTNASLALSASNGGVVQMQSVMQLLAYTVATLPTCDSTRVGGMAYVTDASAVAYRTAPTGGGALLAPVFCTGSAWELH
jgi:hypothetical protein